MVIISTWKCGLSASSRERRLQTVVTPSALWQEVTAKTWDTGSVAVLSLAKQRSSEALHLGWVIIVHRLG